MTQFIGITTKVNSATIRREQYNGHEHWVVPSYTLPANVVMNGGLYPASEIDAHYEKLEGTFAPLGHPKLDGIYISAMSPEGINQAHIGAFNRNVKKSGQRVYVEKWIDVDVANQTEKGRRLLERLEALEAGEDVPPVHTSVGVRLEQVQVEGNKEYSWIAKIHDIDHDAILIDEVGAATPDQGVGLMVNADQATALLANSGVLAGESSREREARLDRAAKQRFAQGDDEYVWVADFTDEQAVLVRNGGVSEVYGYKTENGAVVFSDTGTPVVRQESWVATVVNSFKQFFNHQARPDQQPKEGDMPLTDQERADLAKDIGTTISANLSSALADALKPLTDSLVTIQANQQALTDSLTANQRAEEAAMREEVSKVHGEIVANALSGEALVEMHKSLGTAANVNAHGQVKGNQSDKPKFDEVID